MARLMRELFGAEIHRETTTDPGALPASRA
jgi:hypothetical protein